MDETITNQINNNKNEVFFLKHRRQRKRKTVFIFGRKKNIT
jgi:hypothetical protein